jgi:hypothetical protein
MLREVAADFRELVSTYRSFWKRAARWMLCALGTGFLVVAVALAGNTLLFLSITIPATGTVVSNVRVENRDANSGQTTIEFAPEFTVAGADGKTYTVTSATSSNPPEFAEGQAVRVLYNPMNPGTARIDSFLQLWFLPILFGAVGVVFATIGYTWMYFVVKRQREMLSIR